MSSSGEDSPDWLRSYEAPTTTSLLSLSSSKSSPADSPYRESETISSLPEPDDSDAAILEEDSPESPSEKKSKAMLVTKQMSIEHGLSGKKKTDNSVTLEGKQTRSNVDGKKVSSKHKDVQQEGDDSVWILSSDSEPSSSSSLKDEDFVPEAKEAETARKKAPKEKSPKKKPNGAGQTPKKENSAEEILKSEDKDTDAIIAEEITSDKIIKPSVSSSRLPLVLSEKVNRTKVLIECEGGSIDLSGDMGAVGRVVVSDTNEDVYLDLKGTIYKTTIVPSRTFCVVNVGQSEAKIEAIMNDFIQLKPQSNVYESETMVEGTLEGYSFDSDDEAGKNKTAPKPADQSDGSMEVTNTKTKAKAKAKGENISGKKRGRPSKEKPQPAKKPRKNTSAKKTKAKK